jgi:hypothetical protein
MTRKTSIRRVVLALALWAPCTALAQPRYSVQRLTPPGATSSYGRGLSEAGQAMGVANYADGTARAFLYTPGALGSSPPPVTLLLPPGAVSSQAPYTLGNGGHAVLGGVAADGTWTDWLYSGGVFTNLTAAGFCPRGPANRSGTIPGAACDGGTFGPAALFRDGVVTPVAGGNLAAEYLSDSGQVVGPSATNYPFYYSWTAGTLVDTHLLRLAAFSDDQEGPVNGSGYVAGIYAPESGEQRLGYSLGGVLFDIGLALPTGHRLAGDPRGMNSRNDVFGNAYEAGPFQLRHGYLYTFAGGVLRDVGGFGGETCLHGINASGDVVGHSQGPGNGRYQGMPAGANMLYTGGKAYDLNTLIPPGSGVTLADYGGAINDRGQIQLNAWDALGHQHAYLLTPAPVTTARLGGLQRADGWFRSNVTVTLTATDAVNGIREIHYRTDNGAETVVRPAALAATATATLTVSQVGTHVVSAWAVDGRGNAEPPKTTAVSIDRGSTVISTSSLPGATRGVPYSAQLTAIQGSAPYRWTAVTAPPCGLSLGTTGLLSGTPTCEGTYAFLAQVTGANQATARSYLTVDIVAPLVNAVPDVISITANPDPTRGIGLRASGGTPPYRWSVAPSTPLPAGFGLDSATILAGPQELGASYPVTLTVADARGASATRSVTLLVVDDILISYPPQGGYRVNQPFQLPFSASGGRTGTFTWEFERGGWAIPAGLSLDPTTGVVSGVMGSPGTYEFAIWATDPDGNTQGLYYWFTVE